MCFNHLAATPIIYEAITPSHTLHRWPVWGRSEPLAGDLHLSVSHTPCLGISVCGGPIHTKRINGGHSCMIRITDCHWVFSEV